ncbi:Protein NCBP2AS2 homolog [Anthophora plagiata]
MGIFRMIFAYLMRNEQLINKLADTKPIRRSAQFVAYLLLQSKTYGIPMPFNHERWIKRLKTFTETYKKKLKEVEEEMKKNSPK